MPNHGPKALCWLARLSTITRVIRDTIKPELKMLLVAAIQSFWGIINDFRQYSGTCHAYVR